MIMYNRYRVARARVEFSQLFYVRKTFIKGFEPLRAKTGLIINKCPNCVRLNKTAQMRIVFKRVQWAYTMRTETGKLQKGQTGHSGLGWSIFHIS